MSRGAKSFCTMPERKRGRLVTWQGGATTRPLVPLAILSGRLFDDLAHEIDYSDLFRAGVLDFLQYRGSYETA